MDAGGLCFGARLLASFQRFARPEGGIVGAPPPSLGALPVGMARDGELLLPVAGDEAFWVGMTATGPGPRVYVGLAAQTADGGATDALSGLVPSPAGAGMLVAVPAFLAIPGLRRGDGGSWWAFMREAPVNSSAPVCRALRIVAALPKRRSALAQLWLVDHAEFASRTGLAPPPPLDPAAGYKGWLLP